MIPSALDVLAALPHAVLAGAVLVLLGACQPAAEQANRTSRHGSEQTFLLRVHSNVPAAGAYPDRVLAGAGRGACSRLAAGDSTYEAAGSLRLDLSRSDRQEIVIFAGRELCPDR